MAVDAMIEIRLLSPDYYDHLVSLWEKAGLSYRPKGRDSKEEIARQMEEDPDFFLGAFVDGEMVGCIIATFDGRKGWINRLAVLPEHRRQGIAQMLITGAEDALRKRGAEVIGILIYEDNIASLNLFQRMGYLIGEDLVYLSKRDRRES
jgi:ribosomal protein S18 acetylase RimI-like enzyme